jgi:SAM-dependent methyltransferase
MSQVESSRLEVRTIDREALRLVSAGEHVLDVLFDGERVWSFHLPRDAARRQDGAFVVPWPNQLRRFLSGQTVMTLREHVSGADMYAGEVAFDRTDARTHVADEAGRPLAIDKSGRLQRMFSSRQPEHMAPLLDRIEDVLRLLTDEAGVAAFPVYGTLLGAVREGSFIGHDSDADLGYLSNYEHPADAMLESFRIQRMLHRNGYQTRRYSGGAMKVFIKEADGAVRGLDVFMGFMLEGELNLMGEVRAPFRKEWILPLGECVLEGRTLPCPREPDRMLAAMYGPNWRTPDPAFHFATPRSTNRRFNGWFRALRFKRDQWDQFYNVGPGRTLRDEPSGFARWMVEREGGDLHGKRVIDVGCGTGADALWFARRGAEVTGYDYVPRASIGAARTAKSERLAVRFAALNLAELRSLLPTGALLAQEATPRIVYARFVADTLSVESRGYLWRFADMALRHGGRFYLQFLVDGRLSTRAFAAENHLARINADRVVRELEHRGAKVSYREQLQVGEDGSGRGPRVCRLVVEWPTR